MTLYYNHKPSVDNLVFKVGDTIDFSFDVYYWDEATETWLPYTLTGKQIDIQFRRFDGLLVKSFSTSGLLPAITTSGYNYVCYSQDVFTVPDKLEYDVQIIDGSDVVTVQEGFAAINKQITQ